MRRQSVHPSGYRSKIRLDDVAFRRSTRQTPHIIAVHPQEQRTTEPLIRQLPNRRLPLTKQHDQFL